jgi:hypothetical protein
MKQGQFPAVFKLGDLNGQNGFKIDGEAPGDYSGWAMSGAGDVNGDGHVDLLIGAEQYEPSVSSTRFGPGRGYVIFGNSTVGASGLLNLSSLSGGDGFKLSGETLGDRCGYAVSGAGDVNKDGYADWLIGAPNYNSNTGRSYLALGGPSVGSSGVLPLSSLSGANGFKLNGQQQGDSSGASVSAAGDINRDGYADWLIGAPNYNSNTGRSYLVFGGPGVGGSGALSLSSLSGVNGFKLNGENEDDSSGVSVSATGDINSDGFVDLVIGADGYDGGNSEGASYVVFGASGVGSSGSLSLSSLSGVNGFQLTGEAANSYSGISVSAAGDINGDGHADLLIGAKGYNSNAGRGYVVFGGFGIGSSGTLSLSSLNGVNGFKLDGESGSSDSSGSVSTAGDINGDGYADLLIGAEGYNSNTGRSYVVFGGPGVGSGGLLNLSSLNGLNGFKLDGEAMGDHSGHVVRASDINSDGLMDILIGAPYRQNARGRSYVVFGDRSPQLLCNQLSIHQGQTLILTNQSFSAIDNSPPVFIVSNVTHGQFEWISAPGQAIGNFTQASINTQQVQFVHDGSAIAPSYHVQAPNAGIALGLPPQTANVTFYHRPAWISNQFTVIEGQTSLMTNASLAVQEDYPNNQVWWTADCEHGQFTLTSPGTVVVSQFSRQQLLANQVQFQHDGSKQPPSCNLTLSDGYFTLPPLASNITFISVNQPPQIVNNQLTLSQGATVNLTAANLQATDPDSPLFNLTFYVSSVQHGLFYSLPQAKTVNNFLQENMTQGDIQFIHDNSLFAPAYQVVVKDEQYSVGPQSALVIFNGASAAPQLLNNNLNIAQHQAVILTTNNLGALDASALPSQLTFLISNLQHGQFERVAFPGVAITSFTLQEIQYNTVRFVHDGSENAPSYEVAVSNGVATTVPRAAVIGYLPVNDPPVLINNQLTLVEGETVTLTTTDLSATDPDSPLPELTFTVSNVAQGHFELATSPNIAIPRFTQQQIVDGMVTFVYSAGAQTAPSYQVSVNDGFLSTLSSAATIDFTAVDDAPTIMLNQLVINERGIALLTPQQLTAGDPDNSSGELTFIVNTLQHGQFERIFIPGAMVTSFTQQDVNLGYLRFLHDGGEQAPSYSLSVTDSILSDGPRAAFIAYTPLNDPPRLLSNQLTITEGDSVILNSTHLDADDSDSPLPTLQFLLTDVQQGHFYSTRTGAIVTTFLQQNVSDGDIRFTSDDLINSAPQYFVAVSDGQWVTVPQTAKVSFTPVNHPPVIIKNHLTVNQGSAVILTSDDLSASDAETLSDDLVFTVSNITHAHFEYVLSPGEAVTIFSQDKIKTANLRLAPDGGSEPPAYAITVSDGLLVEGPQSAVINFNEKSPGIIQGSSDYLQRVIAAAAISGGLSFGFLFIRLLISYCAKKRLKQILEEGDTGEQHAERIKFYKEVIRPIANKIFERIKTTGCLGYRGEEETRAYLDAIIHLVTRLGELDVDLEMKGASVDRQVHLFNEIARQTRDIIVDPTSCCARFRFCSWFKPEITPEQLENHVEAIAQVISQSLSEDSRRNRLEGRPSKVILEMVDLKSREYKSSMEVSPSLGSPRSVRRGSTAEFFPPAASTSDLEARVEKIERQLAYRPLHDTEIFVA